MLKCEVTCRGDPGAVFLVSTMRTITFPSQGINTITRTLLLKNLHKLEKTEKRHLHKVLLTDREGEKSEEVSVFKFNRMFLKYFIVKSLIVVKISMHICAILLQIRYYSSSNYGYDAKRTFGYQNILMFSDTYRLSESPESQKCNDSKGEIPCLISGCFLPSQKCDGIKDCPEDGIDEVNCYDSAELTVNQRTKFRNSRMSRFEDFYDIADGDWGWINTNLDYDGEQFFNLEIPETPDDFYFHVFSVSKEKGIGVLEPPFTKSTTRPVDFYCEAPEQVRRGESLSVRCSLINRTPVMMEFVVILKGSEDYSFINVEEFGYVTSYAPRLSSGDHHHFLWLRGESEMAVNMPIAPQIERGPLNVELELSCQIAKVTQELSVEIIPEGVYYIYAKRK